MHYCYILYSQKLDKYYVGSTGNMEERLMRHNSSNRGFTSTGKPWVVVYSEKFEEKTESLARERQIKGWKSRSLIQQLISKV